MPVILEKNTWDQWLNPRQENVEKLNTPQASQEGDTGPLSSEQRRGEGQQRRRILAGAEQRLATVILNSPSAGCVSPSGWCSPSGCCSPPESDHPPTVFRRRSISAD